MDYRPRQDTHFAGPAAAGAAAERNLDAGALQTIQQMLGCSDLDRLVRMLADGLERLIALPWPGTEALDVNRLGRPAERFRRVDHRIHESRRTTGVDVRPLRLAADERGDVELVAQAVVVEPNVWVALEREKGDEGRRFGVAEGVMQLDVLFEQFQMGTVCEQRRNADAARDQQVLGGVLGRRRVVGGP